MVGLRLEGNLVSFYLFLIPFSFRSFLILSLPFFPALLYAAKFQLKERCKVLSVVHRTAATAKVFFIFFEPENVSGGNENEQFRATVLTKIC